MTSEEEQKLDPAWLAATRVRARPLSSIHPDAPTLIAPEKMRVRFHWFCMETEQEYTWSGYKRWLLVEQVKRRLLGK